MDQEPATRLTQALVLLDEIDRVVTSLQPLQHTVERLTGLRSAQARSLMRLIVGERGAIDPGTDEATLTSLADSGLAVSQEPSPATPGDTWRLTTSGQVALEQLQGLRIRIINTVITDMPEHHVRAIQDALAGAARVLADLPLHTGAARQ